MEMDERKEEKKTLEPLSLEVLRPECSPFSVRSCHSSSLRADRWNIPRDVAFLNGVAFKNLCILGVNCIRLCCCVNVILQKVRSCPGVKWDSTLIQSCTGGSLKYLNVKPWHSNQKWGKLLNFTKMLNWTNVKQHQHIKYSRCLVSM